MAKQSVTMRLDAGLLGAIDAVTGKRGRTAWIEDACWDRMRRRADRTEAGLPPEPQPGEEIGRQDDTAAVDAIGRHGGRIRDLPNPTPEPVAGRPADVSGLVSDIAAAAEVRPYVCPLHARGLCEWPGASVDSAICPAHGRRAVAR